MRNPFSLHQASSLALDAGRRVAYPFIYHVTVMKTKVVILPLLAVVAFVPLCVRGAETAQARLWCWSLHFQQGSDSFGDTLDLTTISGTPNGELAPYNAPGEYVSNFILDSSGVPFTGTMYLSLPPAVDDNHNGWPDFFEVTQSVAAASSGTYNTPISSGTVTATWSRGGGSKDGSCVLEVVDSNFGNLGQFRHSFELLEYNGPLAYAPGTNVVNGSINLTKSGDPTSLLQGPFQFLKLAADPHNQLTLQSGVWTNAQSQTLSFGTNLFLRDLTSWPTNYYGYVQFDDGDPTTSAPDFVLWMLSIDDVNDADNNGIPDFSDTPQPVSTRPPRLSLSNMTNNLQLAIQGDVGTVCLIQESTSLPATSWQTAQTVTLTNDPQVVSLPFPATATAFWRIQVQ